MFEKIVGWDAVVRISLVLCNDLPASSEAGRVYLSDFREGPIRSFDLESGRVPDWVKALGWDGQGWNSVAEEDVWRIEWISLGSGSKLEATKSAPGIWRLRYIPPADKGEYEGCYHTLWSEAGY